MLKNFLKKFDEKKPARCPTNREREKEKKET
jgi:hypothetical protein